MTRPTTSGAWGFVAALAAALVVVQVPFLDRPVNYDEANFLTLARGALADPWAPHNVLINWQGTTERAFDVLSNPPGVAWFLAAVEALGGASVATQRVAMSLWALPAALGAVWLAEAFAPAREARLRAVGLVVMPMALMSGSALLPDGPLYALTLLGMGGLVRARGAAQTAMWAFVLGAACLFRYSAVCLVPLALIEGGVPALAVAAPLALLVAHDLSAYGQPHILAMGQFQSVANTPADWGHKAVSAVTFLGGALVLPIFRWRSPQGLGAVLGAIGAVQFVPADAIGLVCEAAAFGAAGGAALAAVVAPVLAADRHGQGWLGLWGGGGFVFLLLLRFTAARYWLPFAPPILLLSPFGGVPAVVVSALLGVGLLADDAASARAVADLADRAADAGDEQRLPGFFTGHWGWQWALEQRGWTALDADTRPPPQTLLATPREAWPQAVDGACVAAVFSGQALITPTWLPRGYSSAGRANLHANWIAGDPPVRTVLPWTFATDPYEQATVCKE